MFWKMILCIFFFVTIMQAKPFELNSLIGRSISLPTRSCPYHLPKSRPVVPSLFRDPTIDTNFRKMMWKDPNDSVAGSFFQTFVPDLKIKYIRPLQQIEDAALAIPN
jgi:hypothetical protein